MPKVQQFCSALSLALYRCVRFLLLPKNCYSLSLPRGSSTSVCWKEQTSSTDISWPRCQSQSLDQLRCTSRLAQIRMVLIFLALHQLPHSALSCDYRKCCSHRESSTIEGVSQSGQAGIVLSVFQKKILKALGQEACKQLAASCRGEGVLLISVPGNT